MGLFSLQFLAFSSKSHTQSPLCNICLIEKTTQACRYSSKADVQINSILYFYYFIPLVLRHPIALRLGKITVISSKCTKLFNQTAFFEERPIPGTDHHMSVFLSNEPDKYKCQSSIFLLIIFTFNNLLFPSYHIPHSSLLRLMV